MTWKAIGNSVIGTSHTAANKPCEDAVQYKIVRDANNEEVLICCVSDGAGSARFASEASLFATAQMTGGLAMAAQSGEPITEADIYALAEDIYFGLDSKARQQGMPLDEYSCTLLGCYIAPHRAVFFQVGDGAVVRNSGDDFYVPVWWPHTGEYHNTTSFITDDRTFGSFNVMVLEEAIDEVAIFSDGLQLLVLNMEDKTAFQPFFASMFRHLRTAGDAEKISALNSRLGEYLDSKTINDRTDDDKTLFLATRLSL